MQLFYHPSAECHTVFTFSKEESGHIARVLRMQKGDPIHITNGKGDLFTATITDNNPKKVEVDIMESTHYPARDFYIHIAIAPTKNLKRTEWFVEKAVETGIEKISFFSSRYSERQKIKTERIEKVALAAMKQSHKTHLPEISHLKNFRELIQHTTESEKWIAHCSSKRSRQIAGKVPASKNHIVLIGPEGGFHMDEIIEAEQNGFKPVELSPYRLRTETAAIIACHWLNYENLKHQT